MAMLHWLYRVEGGAIPRRKTRHLTVTVDGDERDATWKQGVGIYVEGFDNGKGDPLLIEGTPHEVTEMRRMQVEGDGDIDNSGDFGTIRW